METLVFVVKMIGIMVAVVVVMNTAERGYKKFFPEPAQEIRIVVEHHLTAEGVDGKFDITTDVISVAMGIEEGARKSLSQ
jgi:hypothetical protein